MTSTNDTASQVSTNSNSANSNPVNCDSANSNIEKNTPNDSETMEISPLELDKPVAPYRTESLADLKTEVLNYFRLAKQKIQVYTKNLDPRLLSNREIEQTISRFIRTSRNVRVELLITEERALQGVDHRLVNLAQRYTSYITIKIIPKDFHENPFAYYLVDGRYMLYRTLADRYECEIHQLPSSKLKQMSKYFDEVWEQSDPAIHLRALHL